MAHVVINRDPANADDLEGVLAHQKCRIVVDADAENVRVRVDHINQFGIALS